MSSSSDSSRAAYSEASHAFLLKDWDTARRIVDDLLQKTENNTLHDEELARKVWILQLTLLASADQARAAEQPLAQTYARIQRYYAASSSSSSSQVLHPSLLVATSLAGIKLQQPHFVRRTLEDYFDALLCEDVDSEAILDESVVGMDTSNADLSLSGMAINGNGHHAPATTGNRQGWRKSLDRLTRIYTVHLLGKSLEEWQEAKNWVAQQRCLEDAGVAVITEQNAQSILNEIEDAKQAQEKEREAQLAAEKDRDAKAKADAERQRTAIAESKKRKSTSPSSSQGSTSRPQPSSSAGSQQQSSRSTSRQHKPNLSISTPSHPQETGFAALRTHLSSFLSVQNNNNSSSSSSVPTLRHPSSSLQILTLFLKRLAFSKMFNTILVFFLIISAWRRRLGRKGSTSTSRSEVGRYWKKAKDKILETVKMGGSLGYL